MTHQTDKQVNGRIIPGKSAVCPSCGQDMVLVEDGQGQQMWVDLWHCSASYSPEELSSQSRRRRIRMAERDASPTRPLPASSRS